MSRLYAINDESVPSDYPANRVFAEKINFTPVSP